MNAPTSKACGFVIWRWAGGVEREYLLLVNRRRGEVGLPKGHAEPGESESETAMRETLEETGLDLTHLEVHDGFRREIRYPAERGGRRFDKTVAYFLANKRGPPAIRLSDEHSGYLWATLPEALSRIPFENLRAVVRDAALYLKDGRLFDLEPATEAEADEHLRSLPHADPDLLGHLRGAARLARAFAEAVSAKRERCHPEATAAGTLLHDVGRALGRHADHQVEGLKHLRGTRWAAYGFSCVSHFTKGASFDELLLAGVPVGVVKEFQSLVDIRRMTWEERCAALADSCMMGPRAVAPRHRFADLRRRYGPGAMIDLQERRTEVIRSDVAEWIGRDPLSLVGLDR